MIWSQLQGRIAQPMSRTPSFTKASQRGTMGFFSMGPSQAHSMPPTSSTG